MDKRSFLVSKSDLDIAKIADSGQVFRMNRTKQGFRALAGAKCLDIEELPSGYNFICPGADFRSFWTKYFDLKEDYGRFSAAIDRNDSFLLAAEAAGHGIRILRQDPWEMLISFIISQRKSIPAIKSSIEALCRAFGKPMDGYCAFPKPEALAAASEDSLAACSLGYRVPYIMDTARAVAEGKADLAAFEKLSDEDLLEALMTFHGVGPKVANCVSLFGYHRIAAFPVDVWISRVVDEHYDGRFPLEKYEGFAGVLQQYIFYYAQQNKSKVGRDV